MKTTYAIKTPDQILATITVSATVDEFRRVKDLLEQNESRFHWPLGGFYKGVCQVVRDAEAHFNSSQEKEIP